MRFECVVRISSSQLFLSLPTHKPVKRWFVGQVPCPSRVRRRAHIGLGMDWWDLRAARHSNACAWRGIEQGVLRPQQDDHSAFFLTSKAWIDRHGD
jgi:hypothetical protein